MTRVKAFILGLALALFPGCVTVNAELPKPTNSSLRDAVAGVDAFGSAGTAFHTDRGWITAGHVALLRTGGFRLMTLETTRGSEIAKGISGLAEDGPHGGDADWALLASDVPVGHTLEVDCEYKPRIGDKVVVGGHPSAGRYLETRGAITFVAPDPWVVTVTGLGPNGDQTDKYIVATDVVITAWAAGGSSGSPVVLAGTNKVIGIVIELVTPAVLESSTWEYGSNPPLFSMWTGIELLSETGICEESTGPSGGDAAASGGQN